MEQELVLKAVTLALAALGAVLGVMNTWKAYDKDRLKLRVIPKRAVAFGGMDKRFNFCIEVINLSTFPVGISEVGFLHKRDKSRSAVFKPLVIDGKEFPTRLEARQSVTLYCQAPKPQIDSPRFRCAFARTDCDRVFRGSSPAFRAFVKEFEDKQAALAVREIEAANGDAH